MLKDLYEIVPPRLRTPIFTIVLAIFVALCVILFYETVLSGKELVIAGKSYRIGPDVSEEVAQQADTCRQEIESLREQIHSSVEKRNELSAEISKLVAEKAAKEARDAEIWFFVAEVDFDNEGSFSTRNGKQTGRGKWVSPDKDLTLMPIERLTNEAAFETNLPPPANMISMGVSGYWMLPTEKWIYRIQLRYSDGYRTLARVERKGKAKT